MMSTDDMIGSQDETNCCAVCRKSVAGGKGYAHINHGNEMLPLCCPLCLETFQQNPALYVAMREARQLLRKQKQQPPPGPKE